MVAAPASGRGDRDQLEHPMAKNLHNRLARLQRISPQTPHPSIVFVDDEGRVLDDGSAVIRPWVGRYPTEMPFPVQILGGIDPRLMLGLDIIERRAGPPGDDEDQL
jgi:hypothetical protein